MVRIDPRRVSGGGSKVSSSSSMTPHSVVSVALVTVGREGIEPILELKQELSEGDASCDEARVAVRKGAKHRASNR